MQAPIAEPASSDDVEAGLWTAARDFGDSAAREALVLLHLPFARSVAVRMHANRRVLGIEFSDFYQLACVGLLESLDRYDHARGVPFRVFCLPRIEGSILNGLQKQTEVNEQLSLRRRIQRERTASLRGEGSKWTRSSQRVLADLANVAVGLAIGFMLEETAMYAAPDDAVQQDIGYATIAWQQARERVLASVKQLPERERQVVVLHYLHGLQFDQIAIVFELSKGRISQLHRDALVRLRALMGPLDQFVLTG